MSEINILKECKSDYIVRYYGSYFKNNHLWYNKNILIKINFLSKGSLWNIVLQDL